MNRKTELTENDNIIIIIYYKYICIYEKRNKRKMATSVCLLQTENLNYIYIYAAF